MAKVKVNNKMYDVPELGFGHMQQLESEGFNIVDMMRKKQAFSMASALIIICTGYPVEGANRLAEQHAYGGGNVFDLSNAFAKAVNESAFFKKLLAEESDEEKSKK